VFALPSPISDSSSLSGVEDMVDQKRLIDPWIIPTASENNANTPTASCDSPFEEEFPAIKKFPSFASSSSSSPSNSSSWDVEQPNVKTKTTTTRSQKQKQQKRSEKDLLPCLKRHNAHNLIEKRYRNNLNTKINSLRDSIPSLRSGTKEDEDMDIDSRESRKAAQKCNKVNIYSTVQFSITC
jgi:hypothetical protein